MSRSISAAALSLTLLSPVPWSDAVVTEFGTRVSEAGLLSQTQASSPYTQSSSSGADYYSVKLGAPVIEVKTETVIDAAGNEQVKTTTTRWQTYFSFWSGRVYTTKTVDVAYSAVDRPESQPVDAVDDPVTGPGTGENSAAPDLPVAEGDAPEELVEIPAQTDDVSMQDSAIQPSPNGSEALPHPEPIKEDRDQGRSVPPAENIEDVQTGTPALALAIQADVMSASADGPRSEPGRSVHSADDDNSGVAGPDAMASNSDGAQIGVLPTLSTADVQDGQLYESASSAQGASKKREAGVLSAIETWATGAGWNFSASFVLVTLLASLGLVSAGFAVAVRLEHARLSKHKPRRLK